MTAKDFEWDGLDQDQHIRSIAELLGGLPFFELLTPVELSKLQHIVHIRSFGPGETVIRPHAPRLGMYVIQSGLVHVVRRNRDGSSQIVGALSPGQLIGEFSLLDSSPRSSGMVAAEFSTLIGFFQPDLMSLIDTDPKIGFNILMPLSQMMAQQHRPVMNSLRELRKVILAHETSSPPASEP